MQLLWKILGIAVVIVALAVPFVGQDDAEKESAKTPRSAVSESSRRLPPVVVPHPSQTKSVPDFGEIFDIRERKEAFFSYLMPAIQFENSQILTKRRMLTNMNERVARGEPLSAREQRWLNELATYYRVDLQVESDNFDEMYAALIRRVDIIPETLVLIQAANESGWGTSRFAQDARNFFGQWCWTAGCGIVPHARPEGQVYEVRLFDSMESSVRSYIRNLNTHFAYQDLRSIRQELRLNQQPITAVALSAGLIRYSERGEEYIEELNQMIRVNRPIIQEILSEADTSELTTPEVAPNGSH